MVAAGAATVGAATLALSALSGQAQAAPAPAQGQPSAAQGAGAQSVSGPRQAAQEIINDQQQYTCFANIVERESGWDHTAQNPSSGAYGLVQALPGDKMASAGSDWQTNPATQIEWGVEYMKERYGSPCGAWSFWQQNHWY
ncbi:transglycosylase SLT domain-containing protein [Streptomyces durbertensis]|uniref:aggregation-promoting factor C-terminal-like domain-containing protein n=1 Tax=Streptomyces durbertensis TaxID=2448886 RepID=UPI002B202482|nr:transglycosylase SLT domain-containing protein [Streptomyces durbertensis]